MLTFTQFVNENINVPANTRILNITIKELKKIKNNKNSVENLFLWTEDKKIENTIDDLVFVYGDNDDTDTLKLYATNLSEPGRNEFVDGFVENAPSWYDFESDSNTSDPWCAPWTSENKQSWFFPKMSPYEMGRKWLKKNIKIMKSDFE